MSRFQKYKLLSKRLKDSILRKYNFVKSCKVKNDCKRYKALREMTCAWKIQNLQQWFVLHAFKFYDELRNKLS